ncbi:hypothetical protein N7456_008471 [Penicillium angulare]|uniref:Aminoglycoside phosphotransferase domain-containing protein n=1 Tax=Penicillium angulare TaxID=116970 RepID=A0A9W9FCV1_9EURO|nr:hypothetical protein N7456_008471 [Penicillium angulare]
MRSIIDRHKEIIISRGPDGEYEVEFFDQFLKIASEMHDIGILEEDGYCLCHQDIAPRNILLQQKPQADVITGILDWDSSLFAPLFMSCAPPMWLWAIDELDEDDEERFAGDIPSSPEYRQIKELFDEAAGPVFLRYAYHPQYRIARSLFRFIVEGLTSNDDFERAERLPREWDEVRDSLTLAKQGKDTKSSDGQL